ncbi:MAG: SGNH/GDSL hydrolase family protein [Pseudomonadota bacterium]
MMLAHVMAIFGLCLFSCGPGDDTIRDDSRVLIIGDSIMAWAHEEGASVAHAAEEVIGDIVVNRAFGGRRITSENDNDDDTIADQYVPHPWSVVVVNGGYNDLASGCDCRACDEIMDRLISPDAKSGDYVEMVTRFQDLGAHVVLVGYHELLTGGPERLSPCIPLVAELERRRARVAATRDKVSLLDSTKIIDRDNPEHYDEDGLHLSLEGTRLLGLAIGEHIRRLNAL